MKTFVVYFHQVNQCSYSVDANDSDEAIAIAAQKWKKENGTPDLMEVESEVENPTIDSVYFHIEKILANTDISSLKGFFECHENYRHHLELVVRPFLSNIATEALLGNVGLLNNTEIQYLQNHIRQSVNHYVDKFIERGIKEYRQYGPKV